MQTLELFECVGGREARESTRSRMLVVVAATVAGEDGRVHARKSDCNGSEHLSVSLSVVSARLSSSNGSSHVGSSSISDGRLILSSLFGRCSRVCWSRRRREGEEQNLRRSAGTKKANTKKNHGTFSPSRPTGLFSLSFD